MGFPLVPTTNQIVASDDTSGPPRQMIPDTYLLKFTGTSPKIS